MHASLPCWKYKTFCVPSLYYLIDEVSNFLYENCPFGWMVPLNYIFLAPLLTLSILMEKQWFIILTYQRSLSNHLLLMTITSFPNRSIHVLIIFMYYSHILKE